MESTPYNICKGETITINYLRSSEICAKRKDANPPEHHGNGEKMYNGFSRACIAEENEIVSIEDFENSDDDTNEEVGRHSESSFLFSTATAAVFMSREHKNRVADGAEIAMGTMSCLQLDLFNFELEGLRTCEIQSLY